MHRCIDWDDKILPLDQHEMKCSWSLYFYFTNINVEVHSKNKSPKFPRRICNFLRSEPR